MTQWPGTTREDKASIHIPKGLEPRRPLPAGSIGRRLRAAFGVVWLLICISTSAVSQVAPPQSSNQVTIHGTVQTSGGSPVDDAVVTLVQQGVTTEVTTRTNASGDFAFSVLSVGSFSLAAEKLGLRSHVSQVVASSPGISENVELILEDASASQAKTGAPSHDSPQGMQFADDASFTVAGVTDWTAAGGHGSDANLRTTEALTRETLKLKPDSSQDSIPTLTNVAAQEESRLRAQLAGAPGSSGANRQLGEFYLHFGRYKESASLFQAAFQIDPQNYENEYDLTIALKEVGEFQKAREHVQKLLAHKDTADLHRLAGEIDEQLSDPLTAVHEFEQAVRLEPTEQNYFEWGSELLFHRAVLQAQQVFQKGATTYPKSARLLAALATALFSGARYDEAAVQICIASDLNPADPDPYLFMGKMEVAAPNPLACLKGKLARFAEQQPGNSLANYFYAMAIVKDQGQPPDPEALQRAETLLMKAVTLDNKCADAYLQLGVLYASQQSFQKAIEFYSKAIEADPDLAEAHYRLAVAYDRIGDTAKAREEFQLHDELRKLQAAVVDRQRREVKQFRVDGQPTYPAAQ
jgi:tetratricopeptide (TPR) repeat protein